MIPVRVPDPAWKDGPPLVKQRIETCDLCLMGLPSDALWVCGCGARNCGKRICELCGRMVDGKLWTVHCANLHERELSRIDRVELLEEAIIALGREQDFAVEPSFRSDIKGVIRALEKLKKEIANDDQ
jgi:hypothetical protein